MRVDAALALGLMGFVAGCSDETTGPVAGRPETTAPSTSVTLQYPSEDPGPPFYALIERGFVPHTDDWAAIVFVRDPGCVPPGFNLLEQLAVPQAFGCA